MASAVIGALRVTLGADTAAFTSGMKQAQRQVSTTASAIQKSTDQITKAFTGIGTVLSVTLGAAGLAAGTRELLRLADAAKSINAQLNLATAASGNFARAQSDVRRIAAETRSGLEETANLYAVFQRNAHELGISQAEAARATESVSKAFLVSGATAAEAAGGMRQFMQGLQSGTLRGEEFISVMENAPRLALLIAQSLGKPVGALKDLAAQGKLTGDVLLKALTDPRLTGALDDEFGKLPITFSQAMTQIHNAAIETFGAFDSGGEFSTILAKFLTGGSKNFADLARSAEDAGVNIRAIFEGLGNVFDPLRQGGISVARELQSVFGNTRQEIAGILSLIDSATAWLGKQGMLGGWIAGDGTKLEDNFTKGASTSEAESRDRLTTERARGAGLLVTPGRPLIAPENPPARARQAQADGSTKAAGAASKRAADDALRNQRAFETDLARANDDLLAARRATVVAAETIAAFEVEQIDQALERKNAATDADVADKRISDEKAKQLKSLYAQTAEEMKKAIRLGEEERRAQEAAAIASADVGNQRDLASAQGQLARTANQRRDVAMRLLELQYQQERIELEAVIASRDASDAQREIARRRLEMLGQMQESDAEGVRRGTQGPIEGVLQGFPRTAEEANEALEGVAANGIQDVINGLAEAGAGVRSLGDVFKRIAQQILADLIRIQIQKAVTGALGSLLGGAAGSGAGGGFNGGIGGGGLNLFGGIAGARALGGPVSAGETYLVGEEGPELFRSDRRGSIASNKELKGLGGRAEVTIVPTPYFDAIVDGRAVRVAAPLAQAGGVGGAQLAQQQMSRALKNKIP